MAEDTTSSSSSSSASETDSSSRQALEQFCFVWFICTIIASVAVSTLFYLRRHIYPIRAVPVIWPILTHLSIPLAVYSYLFMLLQRPLGTGCYGFNAYILPVMQYVPTLPPFEAQLVHLWYTYQTQTAQLLAPSLNSSGRRGSVTGSEGEGQQGLQQKQEKKRRPAWFYYASVCAFTCLIVSQTLITTIIDHVADNYDERTCEGNTPVAKYSQLASASFVITLSLTLAYQLRDVEEEFNLKKQLKILTLLALTLAVPLRAVNLFIVNALTLDLERIILAAVYTGYTVICGFYPLYLSYKEEKRRRAVLQRHSSSKTTFLGVRSVHQLRVVIGDVKNEPIIGRFRDYLVKEFCCENLLFVLSVLKFRQMAPGAEMLKMAKSIGSVYLMPEATMEINISSSLKSNIQRIIRELNEETVGRDIYEKVEQEVYQMLVDPFNRFLTRAKVRADEVVIKEEGEEEVASGPDGGKVEKSSGPTSSVGLGVIGRLGSQGKVPLKGKTNKQTAVAPMTQIG